MGVRPPPSPSHCSPSPSPLPSQAPRDCAGQAGPGGNLVVALVFLKIKVMFPGRSLRRDCAGWRTVWHSHSTSDGRPQVRLSQGQVCRLGCDLLLVVIKGGAVCRLPLLEMEVLRVNVSFTLLHWKCGATVPQLLRAPSLWRGSQGPVQGGRVAVALWHQAPQKGACRR